LFFFSSRRRHTRFSRDWSSDVCSSDLRDPWSPAVVKLSIDFEHPSRVWWEAGGQALWDALTGGFEETSVVVDDDVAASWLAEAEIGRASCRERVEMREAGVP